MRDESPRGSNSVGGVRSQKSWRTRVLGGGYGDTVGETEIGRGCEPRGKMLVVWWSKDRGWGYGGDRN